MTILNAPNVCLKQVYFTLITTHETFIMLCIAAGTYQKLMEHQKKRDINIF